MRHIIYGAGAIGSVMGGYLAETGAEAVLIGRPAHVDAIRSHGLKISGLTGEQVIKVKAVVHPSELAFREDDVIHLTVKSQDTPEVAEALKSCHAQGLPVFCFQNGVRNEQTLEQAGFSQIYGGIVLFAATYMRPGEVINPSTNALGVGLYPEGLDETARQTAAELERAGFVVVHYERIMEGKYTKLLMNLCNVLIAACDFTFQEAYANEEARKFTAAVMEEGLKVFRTAGIALANLPDGLSPQGYVDRWLVKKEISATGDSYRKDIDIRPSTWQDFYLRRGKSEVDHLNGEIERLGREIGVSTPFNSLLCRINRIMLEENLHVGCFNIDDLKAMLREG